MPATFTGNLDAPATGGALANRRVESSRKAKAAILRRVDGRHCNSSQAWLERGLPGYPAAKPLAGLDAASQLQSTPVAVTACEDRFDIQINLPPHAIAAVRAELARDP